MDIEITPKKSEGLSRLIEVSVPVETVRKAENKAAQHYAGRVRLPGFRPGKAPATVVRRKFADAIRQEAIESLVQDAFKQVVEHEQLDLAAQPHVHHLQFDPDAPLTFELHLEVRPQIELARTSGFRVTRTERPVTEAEVAEQLEQLREQRASWAPAEDRPAPGDLVTVTLATADGDGTMAEGKEYRLVLGGGQAIPGIEELVMETTPGETAERPVRWPEDFPDEAERGQTKTVRVTVHEVKRKSLPELDDAFAREIGDFDTLDALRSAVRADLERDHTREADAQVRQLLLDDVIGANPFDVPQSWVQQMVQAYGEAYGIPEGERERFVAEFQPLAERQVRRDLVIERIAKSEGLEATEADIDARLAELATKSGTDAGKLYASLQKSGRLKELERTITEDRVFAWLLERNEVETA